MGCFDCRTLVLGTGLGVPLLLGSYWALIPGLMVVLVIAYRTARLDRMSIKKLSGYRD